MKEGTYEEINYGDEKVILNHRERRVEHIDYNRRRKKTEEDSAKILAYSLLIFSGVLLLALILS